MMGTLGGLFGGLPVAKLVNATNWKTAIMYLAAFGIIVFFLIMILVPKRVLRNDEIHEKPIFQSMKEIIVNKQIILCGAVAGFMYLPISAFSELWAVPFFMEKYGLKGESPMEEHNPGQRFLPLSVGLRAVGPSQKIPAQPSRRSSSNGQWHEYSNFWNFKEL